MRLIPSDPDVATVYGRIKNGDLNLQPNFQRGEVWSPAKKQKLIDSILREWHVPPIHIIRGKDGGEDEVLDGQQRLVSIRDFVEGKIRVNGNIEPLDEYIQQLHGLRFEDLPVEWRRKFLQFPIRVFSIVDFSPSEPSELFYRLNQPASLTAAEQRNSFFGRPREQIKELVILMEKHGLDKEFLGFSNSRMAYDDVLARVCVALEEGLGAKISANLLADRYRSGFPFEGQAYERVVRAIDFFGEIKSEVIAPGKLNKASLFSWLIFICRMLSSSPGVNASLCANFYEGFDLERYFYALEDSTGNFDRQIRAALYEIYSDRVTSRVADVSSVILRDVAMWGIFMMFDNFSTYYEVLPLQSFEMFLRGLQIGERVPNEVELLEFVSDSSLGWGRI